MKKRLTNAFLKRIEETNELFNKSTPEKQRVMIAQDCIDRIKAILLIPKRQRIISLPDDININKENVNSVTCKVCTKGGLLASYVGRVNNFDQSCVINNHSDNAVHKKLLEVFTLEQLAIIEFAFEGSQYIYSVDISDDLGEKLRLFYDDYKTDEERLIAICENIIDNNGDFAL